VISYAEEVLHANVILFVSPNPKGFDATKDGEDEWRFPASQQAAPVDL